MLVKLKKIKTEINRLGLFGFFSSKTKELYYSYQLKNMNIQYSENSNYLEINGQSVNQDCKKNQPSSYYVMHIGFDAVRKNYSELSLLDIGCGDGKVINFAMWLNFKKVTGIDLDALAVQRAIDNCTIMKKMGYNVPFDVYCTDAAKYIIPADTNVIFMFNPFGRQTMQSVLNNIINYCDIANTELHIIYVVPVHRDLFDGHNRLSKVFEFLRTDKTAEILVYKIGY